jgi:hypothetical protein
VWIGITLLAVVGGVVWIVRRRRDGGRGREKTGHDGSAWDDAELRAAEEEVRDMNAFATPEDADDQLPDWGPGAGG